MKSVSNNEMGFYIIFEEYRIEFVRKQALDITVISILDDEFSDLMLGNLVFEQGL